MAARIALTWHIPAALRPAARALRQEAVPLLLVLGLWLGAGAFFAWPSNPPLGWGVVAAGFGLLGLSFARSLGVGLLALSLGWGLAYLAVGRQEVAAFPWEAVASRSHLVVGRVAEIRAQPDDPQRATLTLNAAHWFGLPAGTMRPTEVRVGVWHSQLAGVAVGGTVMVPLRVLASESPALPGIRDGRLWAWFGPARVNAFASGRLEPTADGERYLVQNRNIFSYLYAKMEEWRRAMIRATRTLGQGVPTALLVGEQAHIPPAVREAYRATGLGHLLAISGMQMTLVGLGVFWLLRWLGAAVPTLALRINLKLWAAIGALAVVFGYTLLVGAGPSIVRAAGMVAFVLAAVLLGRVRGVLRAWALVCGGIVAIAPELALSAALQLSAAATLALGIWAQNEAAPKGVLGWVRGVALATVVAGAATAPIAVTHFGTQAALGFIANLVAIPLMTLASYAGFVALALWPVGLQTVALAPMEWLVGLTTHWAQLVQGWQGGVLAPLGPAAAWGLGLVGLLTLVLAIWRQYLALAALTLASMMGLGAWNYTYVPPQLLMAQQGEATWARTEAGNYRLLWAENLGEATRWARQAKLPVPVALPKNVACCADEIILPKNYQYLAYAQMSNEEWQIAPLRCGRPWQRVADVCRETTNDKAETE
jgi:competence protein ComEC